MHPLVVTNQAVPKCGNAAPVYERSISYAIAHLSKLPNVAIYVDAAHGGWLGWPGVYFVCPLFHSLINEIP